MINLKQLKEERTKEREKKSLKKPLINIIMDFMSKNSDFDKDYDFNKLKNPRIREKENAVISLNSTNAFCLYESSLFEKAKQFTEEVGEQILETVTELNEFLYSRFLQPMNSPQKLLANVNHQTIVEYYLAKEKLIELKKNVKEENKIIKQKKEEGLRNLAQTVGFEYSKSSRKYFANLKEKIKVEYLRVLLKQKEVSIDGDCKSISDVIKQCTEEQLCELFTSRKEAKVEKYFHRAKISLSSIDKLIHDKIKKQPIISKKEDYIDQKVKIYPGGSISGHSYDRGSCSHKMPAGSIGTVISCDSKGFSLQMNGERWTVTPREIKLVESNNIQEYLKHIPKKVVDSFYKNDFSIVQKDLSQKYRPYEKQLQNFQNEIKSLNNFLSNAEQLIIKYGGKK
ncbi:MAG: hypothetical protein ABIC91_08610 [Nanoarchaeota archaeon]|nr:hypothetical protein [Nanoarchaeota archaeon]MBU1030303.1 hypothetical protein [Nanoarchaeota archaeon]MBU1849316.1 hypothetical protein [Nanoarchaeota archaeon]